MRNTHKIVIDSTAPKKTPVFSVDINEIGQRIDNLLMRRFKQVNRQQWYKLIRKGQVRVNGKRIKPLYKVVEEDQIRIPPSIFFNDDRAVNQTLNKEFSQLENKILFENTHFLVLDKPAGLACHGGSGVPFGVIEILQSVERWSYIQLCHRLDRNTSGCLVCAKDRLSLVAFQNQLKTNHVIKTYVAIVSGNLNSAVSVDAHLDTNNREEGHRKVVVSALGKTAMSHFEPVQATESHSLIRCLIETGRTHQIRVHAAHIGHPIVGDKLYGTDVELIDSNKKPKRLYLHAKSIEFKDGEERVKVRSAVPESFHILMK